MKRYFWSIVVALVIVLSGCSLAGSADVTNPPSDPPTEPAALPAVITENELEQWMAMIMNCGRTMVQLT